MLNTWCNSLLRKRKRKNWLCLNSEYKDPQTDSLESEKLLVGFVCFLGFFFWFVFCFLFFSSSQLPTKGEIFIKLCNYVTVFLKYIQTDIMLESEFYNLRKENAYEISSGVKTWAYFLRSLLEG